MTLTSAGLAGVAAALLFIPKISRSSHVCCQRWGQTHPIRVIGSFKNLSFLQYQQPSRMKVATIILLACGFLAVAYAATTPLDLEAEESTEVLTRNKRGLLLAKAALLGGGALLAKKALVVGGGALLAKKALVVGGAGLVGAGLAGAALYKAKSHYGGGYGYNGWSGSHGGYGGYHGGYYKTYYTPVYYSSGSSGWNQGW